MNDALAVGAALAPAVVILVAFIVYHKRTPVAGYWDARVRETEAFLCTYAAALAGLVGLVALAVFTDL